MALRSHRPTQSEVAFRRGDVATDLLSQGFWVWPADSGRKRRRKVRVRGVCSSRVIGWKFRRWDSTVKESAPKVGRLPTLVTASKVSLVGALPTVRVVM